jgi:hypothetical protein
MEVLLVKMQEIITEYQEIANKTPETLDNDLKHIMELCLKWNKAHERCKSSRKIKINNLHDMMNENNIFDAISKVNKTDIPNDAQSIANNGGQPLKDINKVESKDKEEKNDFVDYYNQLAEKYNLKTVSFNGKQIKSNFYCISIKAKQKYMIFEYIEYLENLNNNIIVEFLEIGLGHYILKYQIQGPQPNFKSSKRFGIEKFSERIEEITISTIGENK